MEKGPFTRSRLQHRDKHEYRDDELCGKGASARQRLQLSQNTLIRFGQHSGKGEVRVLAIATLCPGLPSDIISLVEEGRFAR